MANALCYKTKNPVVYNKGTKWEKQDDEFLAMYVSYNDIKAQAIANDLNKNKPAMLPNGRPIDWNEIDYFFINKQDEMW